ncbi:MAG: class I SAM-dependent methyltransferase [bacterium]
MSISCHICGSYSLKLAPKSRAFARVTSDCKPWPGGGSLATCRACGTAQALITPEWREEAEQIYKNYTVYHQGGGAEQSVFSASGQSDTRSNRLVARLTEALGIPKTGHLLDIGCGNGSFLKTFGASFPGWKLSGAEFDDKHLCELQSIPGFQSLHTEMPNEIQEEFDVISLVHTLEHIVGPVAFLKDVRRLLATGGALFIQVPHYRDNPFELMTVDHASHFDKTSLSRLLTQAGFNPLLVSTDWIGREISAVAKEGIWENESQERRQANGRSLLANSFDWLEGLLEKAKDVQSASASFGLFGSSIAATWTAANLPRLPDFFVDEDPARVGRTHMGLKIVSPSDVRSDADVFLALQTGLASMVLERHTGKSPGRWSF